MYLRRVAAVLAVCCLAGAAAQAGSAAPVRDHSSAPGATSAYEPASDPLESFRGLGTWVDIYDDQQYEHPWRVVQRAKARGARTIYLETSNDRSPKAIMRPRGVAYFIHAAHKYDMDIVAWYLPAFEDLDKDHRRTMRAIRFETKRGQRFDAFAMDIESDNVQPISLRQQRMLQLSRRVRKTLGPNYPLGAIIPSPFDMQDPAGWWGNDFPYREVADIYDVTLPMSYSSFRAQGPAATHNYIATSIRIIRRETGNRKVPIHAIGGIGDGSSRAEVRAFMHAVREAGLLGGSFYDFGMTSRDAWGELARIPTNPPQAPALPLKVGYLAALGNVPGEDETHPKEIFFTAEARRGAARLSFEAFDAQAEEIVVLVNWRRVAKVAPTTPATWGTTQTVRVPDRVLRSDRRNLIAFVADGAYPDWRKWGIRNLRIAR